MRSDKTLINQNLIKPAGKVYGRLFPAGFSLCSLSIAAGGINDFLRRLLD